MYGDAGIGTSASDQQAGSPFGGPGGAGFVQEVDIGNIFDSFFSGGGSGGAMGGVVRGTPGGGRGRRTHASGGEEKVRIRYLEKCGTCDGDGVKPGCIQDQKN